MVDVIIVDMEIVIVMLEVKVAVMVFFKVVSNY